MNLEFSYEDYLHNLTKSCEKMDTFSSAVGLDDDNCLDQAPILNKFIIEDEQHDEDALGTLNLSSSLSNTLSSSTTLSSSALSSNLPPSSTISSSPNDQCSLTLNSSLISDPAEHHLDQQHSSITIDSPKLDLTRQLQNAKQSTTFKTSSLNSSINSNLPEINRTAPATKVPKKRRVGVNHKFVNNPKHIKKSSKQYEHHLSPFMNSTFQLKLFKTVDSIETSSVSSMGSTAPSFTGKSTDKIGKSSDSFKSFSPQNASASGSSKGMGCGKPGFITCSICHATKYYSHVQRRFGQFSCEPCSKFMKKFLKDPKVYYCIGNGECQIGKPSGEQEPRGVSVNRCKACWLRICLDKFVLDDNTKQVIDSHYHPRMPESGPKERRLVNERNTLQAALTSPALPPLPLLATRKRKSNDDAEKLISHDGLSKPELKRSRKHKDDQSKSDRRERKRKLIYSPPSTPKRNKKRFKMEDNEFDSLRAPIEQDHQSIRPEHTFFSQHDDSSETSQQVQYSPMLMTRENCNRQPIETSCSLGEDQFKKANEIECGNCSHCLGVEHDLSCSVLQDSTGGFAKNRIDYSTKANQSSLSDDLSEDCIVDNCSELSYELVTSKTEDDYLKESFYDVTFSSSMAKPPAEELGIKYRKKHEKAKGKKDAGKFKSASGKKGKKRKDLLTSNSLMRKSLKKNSFSYILDADSSVIYEVLNANSPFL